MRKWTACVAVMGIATLGFGLLRTVPRQEARLQAEDQFRESIPRNPFSPSQPVRVAPPDLLSQYAPPSNAPPISAAVSDNLGFPTRDAESAPTFIAPGAQQLVPRVKLALTPDHQIQVVAAGLPDVIAKGFQETNAILITAEKFQLTPPTEPEGGNQIVCSGDVEIESPRFTASGTKLSIHNGELVLEGTAEQLAVVTKTAPPLPAPATSKAPGPVPNITDVTPRVPIPTPPVDDGFAPPAPTPTLSPVSVQPAQTQVVPSPAPEFRVSATRITFTLTLDRLQVGNATVITPAAAHQNPDQFQIRPKARLIEDVEDIAPTDQAAKVPDLTPEKSPEVTPEK